MVEEAGDVGNNNTAGIPVVDLKLKTESFLSTIHLEKDLVEADLSNTNLNTFSDRIDRRMYGRISSNTQVSFNVIIPQPNVLSNENVTLTAALRGSSLRVNNGSGEEIDRKHTAEILLQNHRMLQTSFQGDRLAFPSSDSNTIIPLTASILDPTGSGFITVANQYGSTTIRSEAFYANWFELTYPRLYAAFQNQIEFTVPRGRGPSYYIFSLKGFTSSNIRIYRNGISRIINAQFLQNRTFNGRAADSGTWRAEFQAYVASDKEKFYATTEDLILHPIMVKDSTEGLHNTQLDYNYLVIVDDSTSDLRHYADPNHPIHKFVDFKQSQGYKVKVVRVTDIYDEFNFGSVSPLAVRNFLGYAYHNWAVPPKFVLIFSNGNPWHTADPILAERNYVPSIMFQTADFGAAPCDYLYGCIDGELTVSQNKYESTSQQKEGRIPDLYPEIFVGRVPVDSRNHISAYVDKMISQSQSRDFGEWRNRMILIAGAESEFSSQINLFINDELRYNSEPYRLLTGSSYNNSDFLHVKGLLQVMNDSGAGLVTYLGHGGGGQWEDALAFGTKTVGSLRNHNRMSTILSYTCFTGALTTDYGLMSALMVQPEVGAISGVGTASFGWLLNNGYLSEAVFSVLSNSKYRTLSFSELFALGKAKYIGARQSENPDQVPTLAAMYSIFGDPSLKIPVTADTVEMHATAVSAAPGQNVTATVTFPFTPTQVTASLFDTTETPTASIPNARQSVTPTGSSMTISRTIPGSYNEDYIGIRVYAVDDGGNSATGTIRYATSDRNQVSIRPFGPLRVQQDAVFDIFLTGKMTISSVLISLVSATTFVDSAVAVYQVEPGHFRTMPVTGYQLLPGARLDVKVAVPNQIVPQDVFNFYVEGGADPSAIPPTPMDSSRVLYQKRPTINSGDFEVRVPNPTIHVETSASGPVVTGTLYNWGDRQADNIPFEFYYYLRGNAALRTTIAGGVATIPPFGSATVSVPLKGDPPVINDIYLAVKPNQSDPWQDAYRGNNVSSRQITVAAASFAPAMGSTMDGASHAPFAMQHIGTFDMAPGAPAGSGVITAAVITGLPQTAQPFSFATMGDTTLHAQALQLTAYGAPADTADVGKLFVRLYPADTNSSSSKELRIVRYNPTTRQWQAYPTYLEGPLQLSATVPVNGIYGASVVVDRQGPEIKYSVEGQFFTDKSAVPGDARFTAVVLDPSGVNTDLKDMTVLLDNNPLVPVRDFVLLDTTATATTTNIRIQTPLQAGHHKLFLQIADKLGNKSSKSTEFDVETDLSVQVFGNFPNPFDTETFLAYEIRGATIVDEVIVQIFTTAGRIVKTMRYPSQRESDVVGLLRGGTGQPNSLGYHEAWWDARDEKGNEVADGVYFYRLRVKYQDQTIERTGVIARKRQ
jgi:hypothetical protein